MKHAEHQMMARSEAAGRMMKAHKAKMPKMKMRPDEEMEHEDKDAEAAEKAGKAKMAGMPAKGRMTH